MTKLELGLGQAYELTCVPYFTLKTRSYGFSPTHWEEFLPGSIFFPEILETLYAPGCDLSTSL